MAESDQCEEVMTLGPSPNAAESFFLETLKDLEERLKAGKEYNTIRAAGLLRQLLLDGVPLINAANRETKIKIQFRVPKQPPQTADPPILAWMPLRIGEQMETVSRDKLLSRVVLMFQGHNFTVKDVIRAVANLRGGVHINNPRNVQEAAITALNRFFTIVGSGGSVVTTVKGIGAVVLDGTAELVEAIKKRTTVKLVPVPGQKGVFMPG